MNRSTLIALMTIFNFSLAADEGIIFTSNDGKSVHINKNVVDEFPKVTLMRKELGAEHIFPNYNQKTVKLTAQFMVNLQHTREDNRQRKKQEIVQTFIPNHLGDVAAKVATDLTDEDLIGAIYMATELELNDIVNTVSGILVDRLLKNPHVKDKLMSVLEQLLHESAETKDALAELKLKEIVVLPPKMWRYIVKHLALRKCGAEQEYSIASLIADTKDIRWSIVKHSPSANVVVGHFSHPEKKITSLFGLEAFPVALTHDITDLTLTGCFYDFSMDEQNPVRPFDNFPGLRKLSINHSWLETLPPKMFAGLKIETLILSDNKLHDLPRDAFDGLVNLKKLDLYGNPLTQADEEQIKIQLPNVKIVLPYRAKKGKS